MNVRSLSVLICTYNRSQLLSETLTALLECRRPAGVALEIVVVNNRSTDDTAAVVAALAAQSPFPIRYTEEAEPGKAFALNHGLTLVRGDIVALTDDDVIPSPAWLERIVEAFREREITFVFGKILPRWPVSAPHVGDMIGSNQEIWGPFGLVDYGDMAVEYTADRITSQRMPMGANVAFRRDVIEQAGGWRRDLGKPAGSLIQGEDHEIMLRLHRLGLYSGLYDPQMMVAHYIRPETTTPGYFRRWFFSNGRSVARMDRDYFKASYNLDIAHIPRVLGVPRFVVHETLRELRQWAVSRLHGNRQRGFVHELLALRHLGTIAEYWRRSWIAS
jgi:glycosyltransferase involved in cell wall biosynthesis